jgi:hypothetical protein
LRGCRLSGLLKPLLLQQGVLSSLLLLLGRLLRLELLLHHLRLRQTVRLHALRLRLLLPQVHDLLLRHLRCLTGRRICRCLRLRNEIARHAHLLLPYAFEPVHRLASAQGSTVCVKR